MEKPFWLLTGCCIAIIAALLVVGAVSSGVVRHIVQTSPLWIVIVLSMRRSSWSKWTALPCYIFWLLLMTAIWLSLLGWARIVYGTFSNTEIVMTVIVWLASLIGIVKALGMRTGARTLSATAIVLLVALLQLAALWLSLLPAIAHH